MSEENQSHPQTFDQWCFFIYCISNGTFHAFIMSLILRVYEREDQMDPAMRLVSEMILCGEALATYGSANKIPLLYRGQTQYQIDTSAYDHLPEGPVRNPVIIKLMLAAEMDYRKAISHDILGVPGYVQFTSLFIDI